MDCLSFAFKLGNPNFIARFVVIKLLNVETIKALTAPAKKDLAFVALLAPNKKAFKGGPIVPRDLILPRESALERKAAEPDVTRWVHLMTS